MSLDATPTAASNLKEELGMKTRYLILSAVCGLFLCSLSLAQEGSNGRRFQVENKPLFYDLPGGIESVQVKVSGYQSADVIVIKPENGATQLKVMGWILDYRPSSNPRSDPMNMRGLEQVTNISASNIRTNGQEIVFAKPSGSPQRRVVLHLSVPSNLMVSLRVNNRLLSAGPTGSGLMVKGESIVEAKYGTDARAALAMAMSSLETDDPRVKTVGREFVVPPPQTRPDLPYQVSWSKLSPLVIQSPADTYWDENAAKCSGCGFAVLRLMIDQNGSVIEAARINGEPTIGQAAAQMLSRWKFRPFLVEGKAVSVSSIVVVSVADGRLVVEDRSNKKH